jgi:predicted permease
MSTLWQDIRFSIRRLARDRSFTITALLTLGICIAANATMFAVVRSVLLKPLPFPESERIVLLYNSYPNAGAARAGTSAPDYFDRLAAVPALDQQALFRHEGMSFGDEHGVERLDSLRATPSFFRIIRMRPLHGRFFRDDEGERGRALKVILGYGFWQRKFAGRADVVGTSIRMNGNPFEVVGVMPREFTFLQRNVDVYVPAPLGPADRSDALRHANNWEMLGHLAPGATIHRARQQVDLLNARNDERFPQFRQLLKDAQFRTVVVFLHDDVVRGVKTVLYLLWGGVMLVLIIGGVNIANLVNVRATARRREMATRLALGAGLARLARQILTETTLLAVTGGAIGLFSGWWAVRSVAALDLDKLPRGHEIGLDPITVAMIAGLSVAAGLALGVTPALGTRRVNLDSALRDSDRGGTMARGSNRIRRALAMAQVGLAFMLLVGAGLLFASFREVLRLDLGFRPERVATAAVNLPMTSYREPSTLVEFERRALAALRALPDVESAAITSGVPFSASIGSSIILAEGHVKKSGESLIAPSSIVVTPGYFAAMGISLARGRDFDSRDGAERHASAIIDERLAARFWPDHDAIGRRLYLPSDAGDVTTITEDTVFFTVIGVARNVQMSDPGADAAPVGAVYFPFEAAPPRALTFVVRTRAGSSPVFGAIRREIAAIDPQLPVFRTRAMQEWIDRALINRRVPMLIAAVFGGVALLLAAIGVYGVLAYGVSHRRREIAVRMALGGSSGRIFRLVLNEGILIVACGLAIGLAGSILLGRMMTAHLFGVTAADPAVLALVAATLSAIAFAATVVPSWRASKTPPASVLGK